MAKGESMSLNDYIFNPAIGKIKIDFPSICNAKCIGCYTHAFTKDPKKRLPLETIKKILNDAKELGVEQLAIAADGEPLIDLEYFFNVIGHANKLGIESIIYTNGSLITLEIAKKLFDLNTSLLVKRNSMVHKNQDKLLRANLSEKMLEGLEYLIAVGFNSERLALESFVARANEKDLDDVLRFCRKNNLMPYFEEFICVNQTREIKEKMLMTSQELLETFRRLQKIDKEEFNIETRVVLSSRRYNIPLCALNRLVSVDTDGNVKKCVLNKIYGNINNKPLKEICSTIPSMCTGCSLTVLKIS
jgi:MoaA/NifB/PqqE/SkfB family radical SAM enzyme